MIVLLVGGLPLARNLLDRRDELLATNTRSLASKTSEDVRVGRTTCADVARNPPLDIPRGAGAVRLYPGFQGRNAPRLVVSVTVGDIELRGSTPPSYDSGEPVVLRLDRPAPRSMARICVRNEGPVGVALARAATADGEDAVGPAVRGVPQVSGGNRRAVRIDVLRRSDVVGATLVGRALEHASAFKPDGVVPVVIGGALVLVLVLGAGAVAVVIRSPEDDERAGADARPSASLIVGGAAAPADTEPGPRARVERPTGGSWANDAAPGDGVAPEVSGANVPTRPGDSAGTDDRGF